MSQRIVHSHIPVRMLVLLAVLLMGGLFLLTPHTAFAAEIPAQDPAIPATAGDKEGCGCHSAETDSWQTSPHGMITAEGKPAATCETCHGTYVEGHPDEGMIQLDIDSSACTDCHKDTGMEWEGTIHAEAGVQCISCHLSHSQDLRLDSDKLCESCHRDALEDPLHTAHWMAETSCTSCHLADGEPHVIGGSLASSDPTAVLSAVPSHDFVSVSTRNCLECHRKDVTEAQAVASADTTYAASRALLAAAGEAPALRAELATVQQANRALTIWQPITLGAGVSLGGVLGIAFVLAIVRFSRTRRGGDE